MAGLIGLSTGQSLIGYINSIFATELVAEFGWSRSNLALTALASLVAIICIPIAGRLTDLYGVRRVAAVGIISFPLTFVGLSLMSGSIFQYVGLGLLQYILCTTTTTTVYSRIVAERFVSARGLALALLATGPAVAGAVASPALTAVIDTAGWRTAYQVLAVAFAFTGALTLMLLPSAPARATGAQTALRAGGARNAYGAVLRNPVFWILFAATLLCTVPTVLANLHLKMMLVDTGIGSTALGVMVSVFAAGVIVGRLASGLALDRFPAYLVAMIGMGMPCIGLILLSSGTTDIGLLGLGTLTLGLAYGAEGDTLAYLVVRHFGVELYSTVLGLITAVIVLSNTLGAGILSLTLAQTNSYNLFMQISAVTVIGGALTFLALRNSPPVAAREANYGHDDAPALSKQTS